MIRSKLLLKVLAHPSSTLSRADRPPTTLLCDTGGLYTRPFQTVVLIIMNSQERLGDEIGEGRTSESLGSSSPHRLLGDVAVRQAACVDMDWGDGTPRSSGPCPFRGSPVLMCVYEISLLVTSRVLVNVVARESAIGWRVCGVFCFWRERRRGLVGVVSTDPATPASASVEYPNDYEVPDLKWSARGPEGEAHHPECLQRPLVCCSSRQVQRHSLRGP